jgi:hypothetical protein
MSIRGSTPRPSDPPDPGPRGRPGRSRPELFQGLSDLGDQAVAAYTPIVDEIVRTRSTDVRQIEYTLDWMLGFCYDSEMLLLYKKLCRHYYFIDPSAAVGYVDAYREMWDSEPESPP